MNEDATLPSSPPGGLPRPRRGGGGRREARRVEESKTSVLEDS